MKIGAASATPFSLDTKDVLCVKNVGKTSMNASDKDMYVQCSLQKTSGQGVMHRTIWANADKAIVGHTVKVEENDGSWTTDWVVIARHGNPLPKKYVQHQSHAHTRQRAASDI